MANKYRGESTLTVGEETYTIVFKAQTIVEMESKLGRGLPSLVKECTNDETIRFTTLQSWLLFGLKEHHADLTADDAGDLIIRAGWGETLTKIIEACSINGQQTKNKGNGADPNPPQPSQSNMIGSAS